MFVKETPKLTGDMDFTVVISGYCSFLLFYFQNKDAEDFFLLCVFKFHNHPVHIYFFFFFSFLLSLFSNIK